MGISGKARLALLGVTVAATVAVTGAALAAQRDGGQSKGSVDWRLEHQHDRTSQSMLHSMDGSGTDNMWAVGYQGSYDEEDPLVVRDDGSGWREVPVPASHGLSRIGEVAATPTGAWVLTAGTGEGVSPPRADSVLMRWTGAGWDRHTFPDTRGGGVDALTDDDVWHAAVSAGDGAVARHWDGRSWTRSALPGDPEWISGVTAGS